MKSCQKHSSRFKSRWAKGPVEGPNESTNRHKQSPRELAWDERGAFCLFPEKAARVERYDGAEGSRMIDGAFPARVPIGDRPGPNLWRAADMEEGARVLQGAAGEKSAGEDCDSSWKERRFATRESPTAKACADRSLSLLNLCLLSFCRRLYSRLVQGPAFAGNYFAHGFGSLETL